METKDDNVTAVDGQIHHALLAPGSGAYLCGACGQDAVVIHEPNREATCPRCGKPMRLLSQGPRSLHAARMANAHDRAEIAGSREMNSQAALSDALAPPRQLLRNIPDER